MCIRDRAFLNAYVQLRKRIELFVNLPLSKLDRLAVQDELQKIGTTLSAKGE